MQPFCQGDSRSIQFENLWERIGLVKFSQPPLRRKRHAEPFNYPHLESGVAESFLILDVQCKTFMVQHWGCEP